MTDNETANGIDLLQDLVARARKAGADAADAVLFDGVSLSHARRLGKVEKLERSEGQDLGLRVLVGKRQAMVSSSDRSPKTLAELVERTRAAEEAALAVAGITNSEGAEAGWARSRIALAASNGFAGFYAGSSHGVSASEIGGSGTQMERDYDFASAVYAADLRDPAEIGKSAAERAVKRLGAKKMPTGRVPVVFDPRVARSFISHLLGAISGPSIARGTSFLKEKLGQRIFPEAITLTEDPHRPRGHRSKPFDAEGLANRRRALIDKGVLTTWLLDLRSARQLGLRSEEHTSELQSQSNLVC